MSRRKRTNHTPERLVRGVSLKKYFVLRRLVESGKTTWTKLEREEICGPADRMSEYGREVLTKVGGTQ
jgi:hypothetical protein